MRPWDGCRICQVYIPIMNGQGARAGILQAFNKIHEHSWVVRILRVDHHKYGLRRRFKTHIMYQLTSSRI